MGRVFFLIALLPALLCGCGSDGETEPETENKSGGNSGELRPEKLALNWFMEMEHGGYVAAKVHGYYSDVGLDVEVESGGKGAPQQIIQLLAAGKLKFGIANADQIIMARAKQIPLVAIAAPLEHSPRCIMVHEESGFESLKDIKGIELAMSEGRPFSEWLRKKCPLDGVTLVPFSGNVGEFLLKKDFAQQGYVFSEPVLAAKRGANPKVLMLSEIGFDPYASLLVTTEDVIREDPDHVRDMVQASVRGWIQYLLEADPTHAFIEKQNSEMDQETLRQGLERMKSLCTEDMKKMCRMESTRWQQLIDQIVELGMVESGAVEAENCFSNVFVEASTN